MKRRFLVPIFVGAIVLTTTGVSTQVMAQLSPTELSITQKDTNISPDSQQNQESQEYFKAEMLPKLFNYWFADVEMTPKQEKFARAEHARYYQELRDFSEANQDISPDVFNSWLIADGRYIWTGSKALEFEENFLKRLENGMNKQQVQQVRERLQSIRRTVEVGSSLQPTTTKILKSIAEIEIERALTSTTLTPQHPVIQQFDAKLQDLYKQLENVQPQVDKEVVKNVISNAAYEKIDALKVQKSQLITKYSPKHPVLVSIDSQTKQLEALISRNRM